MRWANGKPVCPKCGTAEGERKHYWIKTQKRWKSYSCRKQFSVKVDSIFEDSPLSLDKWLVAMWMLVSCKNGLSSYELASTLGITQKSAWHLLHRIRLVLQGADGGKLGGTVEVDETFIGGKARNMHLAKRKKVITGRGATGKTVVMGMLERGGKVKTHVIAERDKKTLHGKINDHVEPGNLAVRRRTVLPRGHIPTPATKTCRRGPRSRAGWWAAATLSDDDRAGLAAYL
jgi:transposase-like protein